jgi:hypothetical protein
MGFLTVADFVTARGWLIDSFTPVCYESGVLAKISKWTLVAALCLTLGFHWGILQSVAWVGMLINYSRAGSLKDAVCKTFDGQHPCPLCKLVRAAKAGERKPDAQSPVKQIDLFAAPTAQFDFPPLPASSFPMPRVTASRRDAPLLPPPRPFFA